MDFVIYNIKASVYYTHGFCVLFWYSNGNVLVQSVQSANSASPVVLGTGTVSCNTVQPTVTPSAGTMHIQCVPISGSRISVVAQPAGGRAAPAQQIRVLQAAPAQPQVVQQPQQYQVIQQQPPQQQVNLGAAQGNAGVTLIQTASGQLVLQQAQVVKPSNPAIGNHAQIIVNNANQQQVNFGNVQNVQLAGGIPLQSAVAAQPVVLQQNVAPSNRNIIVQTMPAASANSATATNVIQLGQLSGGGGGGTATRQTQHVSSLNQTSCPTSNPTAVHSGVLVQIGGQTYRMQGVQQVQVANAVRQTHQVQAQRPIMPAAPNQPVTHSGLLNVATPSRPSAVVKQINTATHSQPSAIVKQLTKASSSQPSVANLTGQTITLTASQLNLLKQAPPEKQLGMIQQFQRQTMQHSSPRPAVSSGPNSAQGTPVKTIQLVSSVSGSSPVQRKQLPTQTARLSAPTIIRAGPPIAVRVGQSPSSSTLAKTQPVGVQVLRPKLADDVQCTVLPSAVVSAQSAVIGQGYSFAINRQCQTVIF